MKYEMHTKEWKYNIPKKVEVLVLLDLITTMNKKSHCIINSTISIAIDNKKIQKITYRKIVVVNQYNQDSAAKITAIKRIIEQSLIEIFINRVLAYKESRQTFEQSLRLQLIKLCNENAKRVKIYTDNK